MGRLFRRAIKDLLDNRFLSAATIITIALAVLTAGTFGLVFFNTEILLNSWKRGIRLMVYLHPDTDKDARLSTQYHLKSMAGIRSIRFISRDEGLKVLREQLKRQASLLDGLKENPLPDAFEISLDPESVVPEKVETIAAKIEDLSTVTSVEYGQEWFQRINGIFNLFRMGGYILGGVLTLATFLIVANTIRIAIFTRKDEIDIMRLVGAHDGFIKGPFYLQGVIQGIAGSLLGLALLYIGFLSIHSHIQLGFIVGVFSLRFLSVRFFCGIFIAGVMVGWVGSFIALNQFLKV